MASIHPSGGPGVTFSEVEAIGAQDGISATDRAEQRVAWADEVGEVREVTVQPPGVIYFGAPTSCREFLDKTPREIVAAVDYARAKDEEGVIPEDSVYLTSIFFNNRSGVLPFKGTWTTKEQKHLHLPGGSIPCKFPAGHLDFPASCPDFQEAMVLHNRKFTLLVRKEGTLEEKEVEIPAATQPLIGIDLGKLFPVPPSAGCGGCSVQ